MWMPRNRESGSCVILIVLALITCGSARVHAQLSGAADSKADVTKAPTLATSQTPTPLAGGGADAQPNAAAAPSLASFPLADSKATISLQYSTVIQDHGLGFKVKEVKPVTGGEQIILKTSLNPWPDSINVTITFTTDKDSGSIEMSTPVKSVNVDAKGQYPVPLADSATALVDKLNNSVLGNKPIGLAKCEIKITPAKPAPGFTSETLTVPVTLKHVQ